MSDHGPAVLVMHLALALIGCVGLWMRVSVASRLLFARVLVVLFVVSPPLLMVSPRAEVLESPSSSVVGYASLEDMPKSEVLPLPGKALVGNHSAIDWPSIGGKAWLLVALALLGKLVLDLLILRKHLRGLPEISAEYGQTIYPYVKPIHCLVDSAASGPYSVSLWRRVLVIPDRFVAETPASQMVAILKHEGAHLRRRDTIDAVLWQLFRAIFWWNPLIHLLGKRVAELQEWNADLVSVRGNREDALSLSRALIGYADKVRSVSMAHSMAAPSTNQLKRRLRRLLGSSSAAESRVWLPRVLWCVLVIVFVSAHVACTSLLPPQEVASQLEGAQRAMDEDRIQAEVEKRILQVKDAIESDEPVAIEIKFFEVNSEGRRTALTTSVHSPEETKAYIAERDKERETTKVTYPRALTKNGRAITFRSVINEPVVTLRDPETNTSKVGFIPVGTVIAAAPAILNSGLIHCELDLTISSIIGERLVDDVKVPIVSSRVFSAPLVMRSGYSVFVRGLDEAKGTSGGDKFLVVILTVTRKSSLD